MRVKLSQADLKKFQRLLLAKDINIGIADFLNDLIFSNEVFHELKNTDAVSLNKMVMEHCQMEEQKEIFDTALKETFNYVDLKKYENNPYQINLKITPKKISKCKLEYLIYPSKTFFPLDDIKVSKNGYYEEYTQIGISDKPYKYLALTKNNAIWMCITPNEINTMKTSIDQATGNVITFGLGLGYFAYMVSMKDNVKSVTIVDNDLAIIDIFKSSILPHFKHQEKIHIIKTDALTYIKHNNLSEYDYAYFDLWHTPEDGLPLLLNIIKHDIRCNYNFWLREGLIALYRRCLISVIEESLNGASISNYLKAKNNTDKIINDLYFKTQNLEIDSYKKINDLLKDDSLINLMKTIY